MLRTGTIANIMRVVFCRCSRSWPETYQKYADIYAPETIRLSYTTLVYTNYARVMSGVTAVEVCINKRNKTGLTSSDELLWRLYDHKYVITKLWRICDDFVIILWFFENRAPESVRNDYRLAEFSWTRPRIII